MYLYSALNITSAAQIDPTRPLSVGPLNLGVEAASRAIDIINNVQPLPIVSFLPREFSQPVYWHVNHVVSGDAEVFGFPSGTPEKLPTALEVALIGALSASEPQHHEHIISGNLQISLGCESALFEFSKLFNVVNPPLVGESWLVGRANQIRVTPEARDYLDNISVNCLRSSFCSAPLKFRFLELYRVLEAKYLKDVKKRLDETFFREPSTALGEATEVLKSEVKQIMGLTKMAPTEFEQIWQEFDKTSRSNRFVAALFRKIQGKGLEKNSKEKVGAALIYQTRCSIVHSSEKDLIFEGFPDSDEALIAIFLCFEKLVLGVVGIQVIVI